MLLIATNKLIGTFLPILAVVVTTLICVYLMNRSRKDDQDL
jgi:hypothetical protein